MFVVYVVMCGLRIIFGMFNSGWFFGSIVGFVIFRVVVLMILFCNVVVRLLWLIVFLWFILIKVVVGFM